jgi:hypothetical protein
MRKCFLFLTAVFLVSMSGFAQVKDPIQWTFSAKKINATTYEVHLLAKIESGWHIYSQSTPDGGPIPTTIEFTKNPLITFDTKPKEIGKLEQHHEELFGVDVKQFSHMVDFVQTVKLKGKANTSVNGTVEFMTCNDNECLPPKTVRFSIALK